MAGGGTPISEVHGYVVGLLFAGFIVLSFLMEHALHHATVRAACAYRRFRADATRRRALLPLAHAALYATRACGALLIAAATLTACGGGPCAPLFFTPAQWAATSPYVSS